MKVYTGLSSGTSSSQTFFSLEHSWHIFSAEAFSPLSKSQVFILPPTCRHSCSGGFDWNATDDTHESYVLRCRSSFIPSVLIPDLLLPTVCGGTDVSYTSASYCNESMLATMFPLQKSCWHMLIHSMHPVRLRCLTLTINEGSMYRKCPTRS
ncbi:hypothetical protein BKA82DRAFT_4082593 [Pisolithus tinctorius]|nr:hypothetical protein BKA82DRAFT_4082593 [Pisolithus tinctorius]